MPFLRKIELHEGIIGIWKMIEPSDELLEKIIFSPDDQSEFDKIRHERRKREFIAIRLLIEKLMGNTIQPGYGKDGRPFLKENQIRISISHSSDLATVFLSERNIGIDVEATGRSIRSIAGKFLSEQELKTIAGYPDQETGWLIYWCAKEAIFKCTHHQGIDFRSQILILPFEPAEGQDFEGILQVKGNNEQFYLQFLKIENNILVWCVEKT